MDANVQQMENLHPVTTEQGPLRWNDMHHILDKQLRYRKAITQSRLSAIIFSCEFNLKVLQQDQLSYIPLKQQQGLTACEKPFNKTALGSRK